MSARRLLLGLLVLGAVGLTAAAGARGPAAQRGTVVRTEGGDTLVVRLTSGRTIRARLAGVVAPRAGDCFGPDAAARLREIARPGRRVALATAGAGRWYAATGATSDVARSLLADGYVQLDAWGPVFSRFADYAPTAQLAQSKQSGMWHACTTDVSVTLDPVQTVVRTGTTAAFTLGVANSGPLPASNVSVDVRPPSGSTFVSVDVPGGSCAIEQWHAACTFASLAPKATVKGSVVVTAPKPGTIAARATVKFDWCVQASCGTTPLADANRVDDISGGFLAVGDAGTPPPVLCDPSYPTVCIPPPPPRLECNDLPFKRFQVDRTVAHPDPQHLDNNEDGVGCTFDDY